MYIYYLRGFAGHGSFESTHKQSVDFKDLVLTRVQLKEVVLTRVDWKAVELTKSEEVNVELSQASLSSHQSNWKVKSRAQATGHQKFSGGNNKLAKLRRCVSRVHFAKIPFGHSDQMSERAQVSRIAP